MSSKHAIEAQRRSKRVEARRVSVALPPELEKKVARYARAERRLLSPALVLLIEKGLAAEGAAPA